MSYLLDADIFIGAKNLHYGFDFCPAFWEWLIDRNAAGTVFSVEKVGDEVQAMADELSVWAAERGSTFFLPPGSTDFPSLAGCQCLGIRRSLRALSGEQIPSGGRLLSRRTSPCRQTHRRDARNPCRLEA